VPCLLWCTGVLHAVVEVKPEHVTLVRTLGLTVEHVDGMGLAFHEPCVLHRDNRCSVYPHHPLGCQEYSALF
jgi:Fe-S-cluster containining protein